MNTKHDLRAAAIGIIVFLASCDRVEEAGSTRIAGGDCVDCTIRLVKVAMIREPIAFDRGLPVITSSESGRFAVAPLYEPGVVGVFDQSGALVRRLGGPGSGPGEFRGPTFWLLWSKERLLVHDGDLGRLTVFQDSNMDRFETYPLETIPRQMVVFDHRLMLLQAPITTKHLVGHPFHLMDSSFHIISSFGYSGGMYSGTGVESFRPVARAGSAAFWAGYPNKYTLELWNTKGEVQRTLQPHVRWFKEWRDQSGPPDRERLKPTVVAIRSDPTGLLWVFILVADRNWHETNERHAGERRASSPILLEPYIDTVIEVIDPRTGRLIASARDSRVLAAFNDERYVYSFHENENGLVMATAWRPELVR